MTGNIGQHSPPQGHAVGDAPHPSVELKAPFANAGGFCWRTDLPEELLPDSDQPGLPERSRWRLFEDGKPLDPAHALHDDISARGAGAYSHWKSTLCFSTSDNSDPNANGRTYELQPAAGVAAAAAGAVDALEWIPPTVAVPPAGAPAPLLAEILRRRQVREVVYFHTDHFEPWSGTAEQQWRALERFAALTRRNAFSRKLSLFYTPHVMFSLADAEGATDYQCCDGDNIAFRRRSAQVGENCRRLLRPLETEIGHQFHIHVHHENWTRTGIVNEKNKAAVWVNRHGDPAADTRRLDLFLRLGRQTMEEDFGRPFDDWGFVHGNWTLSASDARYCQIEDEIALLMRHGCFGDFTFPAPNLRCQPTLIDTPYTCRPISGAKAYDRPESDPRPIAKGAGLIRRDRFFVWNSPISARHSSLDFYDEENRDRLKEPETVVRSWLEQSTLIDGRLYIKTHAHSLFPEYRVWAEDGAIPHTRPNAIEAFELLQRACDEAAVPFVPATVGEVMTRLREFDRAEAPLAREAERPHAADPAPTSPVPRTDVGTATADAAPPIYRLKKPFVHRSGDAWIARLPFEFEADADMRDATRRSQWQLLEDGVPLRQAHAAHSEIAELGGGRYSHWVVQLYFSSSDNTDPNANGREYALRWTGTGAKPWLAQFAAAAVAEAVPFGSRPDVQRCRGLIAIFGASFSGSTLVNAVLGAHPLIFGGGELHWLINDPARSECAVCGKGCRFWTPEIRASARLDALYHDASRIFGRPYVADISKMSGWYHQALPHYPDLPVIRVLLTKHPVRHVSSFVKKGDEFPDYAEQQKVLAELRRFYQEFEPPQTAGASPSAVDFVIRYEDFVASPKTALAPVLARLGLDYHPRMDLWSSAEHHHIGGNAGPLVQIANAAPALAVSARKYRQRGIFLDNSYLEILSPEDIARIERSADAVWIRERFGYARLGAEDEPPRPAAALPLPPAADAGGDAAAIALPGPFRHIEGVAWTIALPDALAAEGDEPANKTRSPWHLLEDGTPIGRPHAAHADICEIGQGRHSHWGDTLYFASSDNTDPNANGHRYSLARPGGPAIGGNAAAANDRTSRGTMAGLPNAASGAAGSRGADAVEAEILAFLRAELPPDSTAKTPIEDWYRRMYLDRGRGFAPFAGAVIDLLEHSGGRFDRVTEIGAGIGQNCIQLALAGWDTVAVESGEQAYSWMERLLARIAESDPALRARIRPLKCAYPQNASEYLDDRTLACFLGLCSGVDEVTERRMVESLDLAGGVILDPRVFFRHRESSEEQQRLIRDLRSLGFEAPAPVWDHSLSDPGFYPYRFLFFARAERPARVSATGSGRSNQSVAADTLLPNTHIPIAEQIGRVRADIGDDPHPRSLYDAAIARLDIAANQALIARYGATEGLSDPLKYIDCAFWIRQKLGLAILLGLDRSPPLRILDLGTGGGHFGLVCRVLGHEVVGADIDVPLFRDIAALCGMDPARLRIGRGEPLPDLGGPFDLVTAFAAQFDHVGGDDFWTREDWRYFLDDLLASQLRAPGRVFFTLNSLWDAAAGEWRFKEHVAEIFREYGGRGDPANTSVDLPVTDELLRSARIRNSDRAAAGAGGVGSGVLRGPGERVREQAAGFGISR